MRIIGGTARSRRIEAPQHGGTRPIHDRAKEGVFNMLLSHTGELEGAIVYDFFAGSGSFGLEAISRGASHVTFVEMSPTAATTLKRNIETLQFQNQCTVMVTSAERAVQSMPQVDLAFCDPPYADSPWLDLLPQITADVLVGHAEQPVELTEQWEELKRKAYGRSKIVIARRITDPTP